MGAVAPLWGWAGSDAAGWEWPKASPACDTLGQVSDDRLYFFNILIERMSALTMLRGALVGLNSLALGFSVDFFT